MHYEKMYSLPVTDRLLINSFPVALSYSCLDYPLEIIHVDDSFFRSIHFPPFPFFFSFTFSSALQYSHYCLDVDSVRDPAVTNGN